MVWKPLRNKRWEFALLKIWEEHGLLLSLGLKYEEARGTDIFLSPFPNVEIPSSIPSPHLSPNPSSPTTDNHWKGPIQSYFPFLTSLISPLNRHHFPVFSSIAQAQICHCNSPVKPRSHSPLNQTVTGSTTPPLSSFLFSEKKKNHKLQNLQIWKLRNPSISNSIY